MAVTPAFDIDRSSPTPLYFQLSQAMERAISDGSLPAGSKLENELLLTQHYGLSRPTVRRAVQDHHHVLHSPPPRCAASCRTS